MDKDHILIQLSDSDRTSVWKKPFATQSTPQKVFTAIWEVEAEVNNGGFSQYFENSSCETAHFVVEALEKVGAPLTAGICRRAIATAFPTGLPTDPRLIRSSAAQFSDETSDSLNALTTEFFTYPNNLTDLLFQYVSEHPDEFGVLPIPDNT